MAPGEEENLRYGANAKKVVKRRAGLTRS